MTFLEVHHLRDWIKGGATDTDNLGALCPRHHHALHRGEYTVAGNPNITGDLKFYDSRGRLIPSCGKPNQPTGSPPGPPAGKKYHHPTGERFDTRWLTFAHALACSAP